MTKRMGLKPQGDRVVKGEWREQSHCEDRCGGRRAGRDGAVGGRGTETSHGARVGPGAAQRQVPTRGGCCWPVGAGSTGRRRPESSCPEFRVDGSQAESSFQDAPRKGEAGTEGGGLRGRQTPGWGQGLRKKCVC